MADATTDAAVRAYDELMARVYVPAFFGKLAEYGIAPADADRQRRLLEGGLRLLAEEAVQQEKQAQAGGTVLDAALDVLDGGDSPSGDDDQALAWASALAADPEVTKYARAFLGNT